MSELFIQRPITTTLIMAGIVLFGLIGYQSLPVSDLPNVDYPTIQVSAGLPGASPETMASSVATPLERQFSKHDILTMYKPRFRLRRGNCRRGCRASRL